MSKGIKETKEVLAFLVALVEIVGPEVKDGFQGKDVLAVVEKLIKPENVAKMEAAIEGISEVGAEASDLGIGESFELLGLLVAALKKLG